MRRHKRDPTPTGDGFMRGTPTEDIRQRYNEQQKHSSGKRDVSNGVNRTHAKYVVILLACLLCRDGMGPVDVAKTLSKPTATVSGWLYRMHKGGLEALYDKPKPGRPPKIDPNLHQNISESIDKQPAGMQMSPGVWSAKTVILMLSTYFSIDDISPSTVYALLHRINKSWRKLGRRRHPKSPPEEVKKQFMTELKIWMDLMGKWGYVMAFLDEAHITTATILAKTWAERGAKMSQKAVSHGWRRTCFGAVGVGGVIYQFYEKGDTESMKDFVTHLHRELGKVALVMDNASYHKSKDFRDHLETFNGEVIVIFLPPYSPDLNPVEMLWREFKRYVANKLYTSMDDMTEAMDQMLVEGIVDIPAMPECVLGAAEWEPQQIVSRSAIA